MMKKNLLIFIAIAFANAEENVSVSTENEVSTISEISTTTTAQPESSSVKQDELASTEEATLNFQEEQAQVPTSPRKKLLYINQQQSGKFNVHLELNDVSLIVVPNRNDPQLSLLNLLLRSAQKSNNLKKNEHKEVEKKDNQSEDNAKVKLAVTSHENEYSKFKSDDHPYVSPTSDSYMDIESRIAPYKVDISSTLKQPSSVEILPNSNLMARSPLMKLLKPLPIAAQHPRVFKRSIDTHFFDFDSPVLHDKSISSSDREEDELTESITNSLENNNNVNDIASSDFFLLGAVENCGPGRKRNSYQICVPVES